MDYIIQFEYASLIICAIIQVFFFTRNSFVTRSSRIFFVFITCCMLTTIFDIVSAFTIMNPTSVPLWINYIFAGGYVALYVTNAFLFLLYIDSITKIPSMEKPVRWSCVILIVVEFLLFVTTPFSKLFIYFDENLIYTHGPVFYINYALGFFALIFCLILVFRGRVRISNYKRVLIVIFIFMTVLSVAFQVVKPNLLLGGFGISIGALYLYICFENPAYSFYMDTRCYNRAVFTMVMKANIRENKAKALVLFRVVDYHKYETQMSRTEQDNLSRAIAEKVARAFKGRSFMLKKYAFVVMTDAGKDEIKEAKRIQKTLNSIFKEEIPLVYNKIKLSLHSEIIPSKFEFENTFDLDRVIEAMLSYDADFDDDTKENIEQRVESVVNGIKRRADVLRAMEKAIEKESFKVFYQPIYNVKSGKFGSSEALVRLIDDEIGFVPPDEFIPLAEETGHILKIGELVFKKVCEFMSRVDRKTLGIEYIEVNLSPVQCEDPEICDVLFNIMEETGTDPSLYNFEITETAETEFSQDSLLVKNIIEMNNLGLTFSVDDFGSGFASMDYLFRLPINLVKVDRSILWQAMKDEKAMTVLISTINMVKELGMRILVEGVEDEEMVNMLKENGCNYMQGFYFSKPVPEAEYIEYLRANNS